MRLPGPKRKRTFYGSPEVRSNLRICSLKNALVLGWISQAFGEYQSVICMPFYGL